MDISEETTGIIADSVYRSLYKKKKRKVWIHPMLADNARYFAKLFPDLESDEDKWY